MLPLAIAGLIVGGAGVIGGALQSSSTRQASRDQIRAQENQLAIAEQAYNSLSPYYQGLVNQLPPEQALQKLMEWAPTQVEDYDIGTVSQYLDPSIDYQTQQASKAILAGKAATGSLGSGATLKALSDRAQQIGQAGWGDAFNRSYAAWKDKWQMDRAQSIDQLSQLQALQGASSANLGALTNLGLQRAGMQSQVAGNIGDLQAQATASKYLPIQSGLQALAGFAPMGAGMYMQQQNYNAVADKLGWQ